MQMRRAFLIRGLGLSMILLLCSPVAARQDSLYVTEIQVAIPALVGSQFEPEIHLLEAGSNRLLGCAGFVSGLNNCSVTINKQVSLIGYRFGGFYSVQAFFLKPDSTVLRFSEIANSTVYLRVYENKDTLRCPDPPALPPDQILGTSPTFPASSLDSSRIFQFDQVSHLRLGRRLEWTPQPDSPVVKVKEIAVTGISDGIGKLEIEVHLYDQDSGEFLGCSGQINGLERVDLSEVLYRVDADFQRPFLGPMLTLADIRDRSIYAVVKEDDSLPCPCPDDFVNADELVGITPPFTGVGLQNGVLFTNISNLRHLALSLQGVPARVSLIAPEHLALVRDSTIVFTWQPGDNVPVDDYQVQIAVDSLMQNVLFDTTLSSTQLAFFAPPVLQQNRYWWRVRGGNATGWGFFSAARLFIYLGPTTDVESPSLPPISFRLHQNYPNPFNPATVIRYQLPVSAPVKLSIYSIDGQLVRTLVDEQKQAGLHHVVWNGRNDAGARLPSGAYLYRIEAGEFRDVRRMLLIK